MSARRRTAVLAGVLAVLTAPLVATAAPDDRGPVRSEPAEGGGVPVVAVVGAVVVLLAGAGAVLARRRGRE